MIDTVTKLNELRAASIFQRHLGDLLRLEKRMDESDYQLMLAEASAYQAEQYDILHYALISKARLMRDRKDRGEAMQNLRRAELYAESMGLFRMTAEVFKVKSELLLSDGEATQAGILSAKALAMSKRNGMRLRKISAAILHAKVYQTRGQTHFARQLIDEVILESNKLDYGLKSDLAGEFRESLMP